MHLRVCFAIIAVLSVMTASSAWAQNRVALVIGNNTYTKLAADKQLANAANDARAVSEALTRIGFKVTRAENLTREKMVDQLFNFAKSITAGDIVLVYFAGHGISINGANFLLPVDIQPLRAGEESKTRSVAFSEGDIIADIQERKPRVLVMLLDACRDNPFRQPGTRSIAAEPGLTRGREAEGVFSIYSAGFGQTALDRLSIDDKVANSLFTRVLIPALERPGVHLADMVIDLREEVGRLAETVGHHQYPAYYDQTRGGRVYLAGPPSSASSGAVTTAKGSDRRTALLIGNSDYQGLSKLRTPGNDVIMVAAMLRNAGFDSVVTHTNLGRDELQAALRRFSASAASSDVALLYYSGHAVRIAADRYLFGIDAQIGSLASVGRYGVLLNDVIGSTSGGKNRVVVIDGDQSDPFNSAPVIPKGKFDKMETQGATVLYAAGTEETSLEGDHQVSPFTSTFVQNVSKRGLPFADAVVRIQKEVAAETRGVQNPALIGSMPPAAFSLLGP